VEQIINEFQESNTIHLLMMIKSKDSFFKNLFTKSLIHKIVFRLNVPLLVIPAKM